MEQILGFIFQHHGLHMALGSINNPKDLIIAVEGTGKLVPMTDPWCWYIC